MVQGPVRQVLQCAQPEEPFVIAKDIGQAKAFEFDRGQDCRDVLIINRLVAASRGGQVVQGTSILARLVASRGS